VLVARIGDDGEQSRASTICGILPLADDLGRLGAYQRQESMS